MACCGALWNLQKQRGYRQMTWRSRALSSQRYHGTGNLQTLRFKCSVKVWAYRYLLRNHVDDAGWDLSDAWHLMACCGRAAPRGGRAAQAPLEEARRRMMA